MIRNRSIRGPDFKNLYSCEGRSTLLPIPESYTAWVSVRCSMTYDSFGFICTATNCNRPKSSWLVRTAINSSWDVRHLQLFKQKQQALRELTSSSDGYCTHVGRAGNLRHRLIFFSPSSPTTNTTATEFTGHSSCNCGVCHDKPTFVRRTANSLLSELRQLRLSRLNNDRPV